MFDLYWITPARSAAEIAALCTRGLAAARPGRVALQLRARHLPARELRALALSLRGRTRDRGVALFINGDPELAAECDADGVQLPERGATVTEARRALGNEAQIGVSRHDLAGLRQAAQAGADFATLSPVFAVPDKGAALGVAAFGTMVRSAGMPVLALGGIACEHVRPLLAEGAQGVAVIRGIADAADPAKALREWLDALEHAREIANTGANDDNSSRPPGTP